MIIYGLEAMYQPGMLPPRSPFPSKEPEQSLESKYVVTLAQYLGADPEPPQQIKHTYIYIIIIYIYNNNNNK